MEQQYIDAITAWGDGQPIEFAVADTDKWHEWPPGIRPYVPLLNLKFRPAKYDQEKQAAIEMARQNMIAESVQFYGLPGLFVEPETMMAIAGLAKKAAWDMVDPDSSWYRRTGDAEKIIVATDQIIELLEPLTKKEPPQGETS